MSSNDTEAEVRSDLTELLRSIVIGVFGMTLGFTLMIGSIGLDFGISLNRAFFKHALPLGAFGGMLFVVLTYLGRRYPKLSSLVGFAYGLLLAPYILALVTSAFTLEHSNFVALSCIALPLALFLYRWHTASTIPSSGDMTKCLLLLCAIHPLALLAGVFDPPSGYYPSLGVPIFPLILLALIYLEELLLRRFSPTLLKVVNAIDSLPGIMKAVICVYCSLWIVTIISGIPDIRGSVKNSSLSIGYSSPFPFYVSIGNNPDCFWERERIKGGYLWFFGYRDGAVTSSEECPGGSGDRRIGSRRLATHRVW